MRDLGEAARLLHEGGRSHIHFLLAARDTDWRYSHGDRQPWKTMLTQHQDITLRELRDDDANMLVSAWQKYGSDGLRELASLPSTDKQVAALLHAVHGAAPARDEGSFFGGLLAVRFGPDGLRNHVVSLLTRLKAERIENSDRTLFDALLYVAACHTVGSQGLDESVLADLLGVSGDWVQTLVVNPLGEEAAAVRSAGSVLTRHSKVAAAILVAAEQELGADVAEIWSAVVRQTVRTRRDFRVEAFSQIVHAGPRLQRELPQQFTEQRRKEIAVAAAKASVAAESNRLSYIVDLGKTYRNAGDLPAAVKVFRDNLATAPSQVDFADVIRGYWYEWGVAEGSEGDGGLHSAADAWLQGLSLADHLKPAPITGKNTTLSCAGLGVAFGKLAEPRADGPFASALRASAYLGRLTTSGAKALSYFNKHDRDGDKIGTPHPRSIEEAIGWLTTAVAQAGREIQDPFLKALLRPEQVSFNMFREFLEPGPPPARAQRFTPPTPKVATEDDTKPVQLPSAFGDRIQAGIERVITEAWHAVSRETATEDSFRVARRHASQVISRLSPQIKRQVAAYFETQKWEPLKARAPKS